MSETKYKEGEEFYEIIFEMPKGDLKPQVIVNLLLEQINTACNIRVIPCKIEKEPSRLSVSKDDYSYSVWKSKQKSQIIE